MDKEFIPYEEALALKELGFDEPCFGGYYETFEGEKYLELFNLGKIEHLLRELKSNDDVLAPTFSQSFRWFRNKHSLYSEIQLDQTMEPKFCYSINWYKETDQTVEWIDMSNRPEFFLEYSYEKAELSCLKKLIEIVKNK